MAHVLTAGHNGKWKTRLVIGLALIVPLYIAPSLLRAALQGWWWYGSGVLAADVFGSVVVGFLTNNYKLGVLLYVGSTVLELLLLRWVGGRPQAVLWIGDLIPAVVAIYYAQQLFINMGD
jgi:CDP-diglyceride synthetase